ncbi:asparaginyl-tRNA synthetase [Galdieria sulphuraria]|uniref:asparagine--tRNA ligase n=1 Tax=Galdieria sulphuraria TaxID=130081 RepID=M2Y837_GALSU|nr:asparaginyl-tRNA synthetase [Galdieria sulphuraria]EME31999.1 asparaginyl-tRNA synthetase [Galdieria sulphuraria]|eukprot:XP_005708519.1 asparaginyl-tRNA synthetase [Galdieria sulphuraria]
MTTCSFVVSCASNTLRFCKSFQHKNLYTSPALLHCWSKAHLELFRSLLVVKPSARQRYRPSRTLSSSSTIFSGERNCKCCTTTEEEHKVQEPPFSGKSESFNDWTTRDSAKVRIKTILEQGEKLVDKNVTIQGWIRSIRDQKKFAFLVVNDGSCLSGLQIFVESTLQSYEEVKSLLTGSSVSVSGKLVHSIGKGQFYELQAEEVRILGDCDASYPLQKKRHSFEYLRRIAHLRPRTNTFGAVMRVRSMLAFATHCFFQENGFVYIHSPIITSSDCEGAGEMFRVLTEPGKSLNDARREDAKNFFGIPTFLTVSGQLSAEAYSCALRDVYTFGPAFRAEYSNTTKHLSEFWMVEPEMAFANLQDDMNNAESYVKFVIQYVLEKCKEDIDFFDRFIQNGLKSRLHKYIEKPFARISYSEAVEILQNSGNPFQFPVSWGEDLATEHERYLAEEYFDHPVFVYNYPAAIKAFYMKNNDHDSGKTVAAMDLLVPRIGELIGGSEREDRLDVLEQKMHQLGLKAENYWWYLDLRRFGSVPHAGYGLGFERLVLFVTGMENIRDVIPFPRFPGSAEF